MTFKKFYDTISLLNNILQFNYKFMYRNEIILNSDRKLVITIKWELIQIIRDWRIEKEFEYFLEKIAIQNFYKMAIMR